MQYYRIKIGRVVHHYSRMKYYCCYYNMLCFTTAQESAQFFAQLTLNCNIKTKNKSYILMQKFHCFVKTKYAS